jgi:hypothetical protein
MGFYQWRWSVATGSAFSPAEAFRFAQAMNEPIAALSATPWTRDGSLVESEDPAMVVFRYRRAQGKLSLWVTNFAPHATEATLRLPHRCRSARRVDFEGRALPGERIELRSGGRALQLKLDAWRMAALELSQ